MQVWDIPVPPRPSPALGPVADALREHRGPVVLQGAATPPGGQTLLAWGIFNPMGPTASRIDLIPVERGEHVLAYAMEHPFLAVYVAWAIPYVRSGGGDAHAETRVSLPFAATLLALGGVGSAFVSDWFIHALDPAVESLGISKAFAGLVIVAIAGNAVENAAGLVLAHKGQADLAISVVKNSVAQVAAFLFPALVLVSLLFTTPLTFSLAPVYIGAIILTAIVIAQVTGDGQATAFEGWALVAVYAIIAVVTLYE